MNFTRLLQNFARWLQQKIDEVECDPYAPGALFKLDCLRVLICIFKCILCDHDTYYTCKNWVLDKYASCCDAAVDALKRRKRGAR